MHGEGHLEYASSAGFYSKVRYSWIWSFSADANAFARKHNMQYVFCRWSLIRLPMQMSVHGPRSMTCDMF